MNIINKFRYFWNIALIKDIRRKRQELDKKEKDVAQKLKTLSASEQRTTTP